MASSWRPSNICWTTCPDADHLGPAAPLPLGARHHLPHWRVPQMPSSDHGNLDCQGQHKILEMSCLQGCNVLPIWDSALQKQDEAEKLGFARVLFHRALKRPMKHLYPKKAMKIGHCRHGPSTGGIGSSECFAGSTSGKTKRRLEEKEPSSRATSPSSGK